MSSASASQANATHAAARAAEIASAVPSEQALSVAWNAAAHASAPRASPSAQRAATRRACAGRGSPGGTKRSATDAEACTARTTARRSMPTLAARNSSQSARGHRAQSSATSPVSSA
jgi:hypothetical protein